MTGKRSEDIEREREREIAKIEKNNILALVFFESSLKHLCLCLSVCGYVFSLKMYIAQL